MIDSDKRDIRTRGEIEWDFVILCGKRCFSVINKVEEIRISCECVGGLILEAIPNRFSPRTKELETPCAT